MAPRSFYDELEAEPGWPAGGHVSFLDGKRVVVTRARHQAAGLVAALREAGAVPILCPTIEVAPPESWAAVDAALDRLPEYGWVVFTSSNGVRSVMSRLSELGRSPRDGLVGRSAAVGPSTARTLSEHGVLPAFLPEVERSRALAEALPGVSGERVLLPRADIADPEIAETLRRRGASRVDDVVAYRTLLLTPEGEGLAELRRGVDGITFTSSSTVRGFLTLGLEGRRLLEGVAVVTLGAVTTDVARREGLVVAAQARERSMNGLVDALCGAFESQHVDEEKGK